MTGLKVINKKGFTLVELIVVIAILGIVMMAIYSFFSFGNRMFGIGKGQTSSQSDIRLAHMSIKNKVQFATEVQIVDVNSYNAGIDPDTGDKFNYVCIDGDSVKYSEYDIVNGRTTGVLPGKVVDDSSFFAPVSGNPDTLLVSLTSSDGGQSYTVDSRVKFKNFQLRAPAGTVAGTQNKAIKFKLTQTSGNTINLNKNSTALNIGDSETLVATTNPSQSVTWSSSDNSVATVSTAGVVTGNSLGTAYVTATTSDGNHSAYCFITVKTGVTGVALNKSSTSIDEAAFETLSATVAPDDATEKAVIWTSSDNDIATVDQTGKVTGVSKGTATITATTLDGGFTATCTVTVMKRVVSVSLEPSTATVKVNETRTLVAAVSPVDASNTSVTWSSDNTSVATVSSTGAVTGISIGTARITVTTSDGGKTDTCDVTVTRPNGPRPISINGIDNSKFSVTFDLSVKSVVSLTGETGVNNNSPGSTITFTKTSAYSSGASLTINVEGIDGGRTSFTAERSGNSDTWQLKNINVNVN